MEVKELVLKKQIEKEGGELITTLTLREPTAGELDFAEVNSSSNNGRTIRLIAAVSGVNEKYIRQLGGRDYTAAAKFISSFLDEPLPTTES